ncbi:MAG: ATP:cob(I)alamin adenosyltransferase [Bdellovibrionales bacterium CG10_big_fil_rev_8_21_14_0_10_45_34]|nr:MAG: ATP:cob(I)alamin adenosyltransferase [Bdellovibrionales bacterium CG10_big_fil_rev_8_21_14_0_10_45_34]
MNSGVRKSAIYTRSGDQGMSSLIGGQKVSKNHYRLRAYGSLDELNSFLGLAHVKCEFSEIGEQVLAIQSDLFVIGSHLACEDAALSAKLPQLSEDRISVIERDIDKFDATLSPLKNFILPGGSEGSALLHVCRTICRRAEREIVAMHESEKTDVRYVEYLNRLSDYLFVAARAENQHRNVKDTVWNP